MVTGVKGIKVEHVPGTGLWLVVEPFSLGRANVWAGFLFDGASLPRFLWWYMTPADVAFEAAAAHDLNYLEQAVSRRQADAEFYVNLRLYGNSATRSWLMWAAVRLFGWLPWRRLGSNAARIGI